MPSTKLVQKRRQELFTQQGGRCYWCGCQMRLPAKGQVNPLPEDMATLDHLDTKRCAGRAANQSERYVVACFRCNNTRGCLPAESFRQIMWGNYGFEGA